MAHVGPGSFSTPVNVTVEGNSSASDDLDSDSSLIPINVTFEEDSSVSGDLGPGSSLNPLNVTFEGDSSASGDSDSGVVNVTFGGDSTLNSYTSPNTSIYVTVTSLHSTPTNATVREDPTSSGILIVYSFLGTATALLVIVIGVITVTTMILR